MKPGTHRRGHYVDHAKRTRNGLNKAVAAAAIVRQQTRRDCYARLLANIQTMHEEGDSFAEIAFALNDAGHVTTGGNAFAAMTVKRIADAIE